MTSTRWDRRPESRVLWTVVPERDMLGDDLVPDYLTRVREGDFYGWPWSYWGTHVDERVTPPKTSPWNDQRVKRRTPRAEVSTRLLPASVTVLSPLRIPTYAASNAIVGHAARVHASAGPAVRVCPDTANEPLQVLQSARVESRPSASDSV